MHTPGPWRYLRYDNIIISDAVNGRIVDVQPRSLHVSEVERDANGRLCAAAPEMAEAIEQALDDMGDNGHCVCEQAKQMLRTALSKARSNGQ